MLRLAAAIALLAAPALAQGTGEAALTLDGRTMFLSADNASSARPMIRCETRRLSLTFAQLHLRFPMPPFLDVTLVEGAEGWRVEQWRLDRTGTEPDVSVTAGESLIVLSEADTDGAVRFALSGEALGPAGPTGTRILPVELDVTVTCPEE